MLEMIIDNYKPGADDIFSNLIDNIVVSSDSDLMLDMALKKNVKTHKRSIEFCDEKTQPFGAVVKHICESVDGENIIWSTVTSPLISKSFVSIATSTSRASGNTATVAVEV